jgi:hypothetical protein
MRVVNIKFSKNQKLPPNYKIEWWESDEFYHWVIDRDIYSIPYSNRFMAYRRAWLHYKENGK